MNFDIIKNDDLTKLSNLVNSTPLFKWPLNTCSIFAEHGALNCLKYAIENGCQVDAWAFCMACANGHTHILKFFKEKMLYDKTGLASMYASSNGFVDCLQFCHKNMYPISKAVAKYAAEFSQLETLKYCIDNNFPIDEMVLVNCCKNFDIECLKYAYYSECPNSFMSLFSLLEKMNLTTTLSKEAIECLHFCINHRFPIIFETLFLLKIVNKKHNIINFSEQLWILYLEELVQKNFINKYLKRLFESYIEDVKRLTSQTVPLPEDVKEWVLIPYIGTKLTEKKRDF